MARTNNSLKSSINTLLEQISLQSKKYSIIEQTRINNFTQLLKYFEEADFNRQELVNRLVKYREETLQDENYLKIPFLWFSGTFIRNAKILLEHSKFHATSFYEYLVKHLRDVYKLINRVVSLSHLEWEDLQYRSNKLLQHLTKRDLKILKSEFSLLMEKGVNSFDYGNKKRYISQENEFAKNEKPMTEIKRLFTLLDAKWFLQFSSPAFGLYRVFFELEILNSLSFKDIIDFTFQKNTTLIKSDIFRTRKDSNKYLGFFVIPMRFLSKLESYLKKLQNEGHLKLIRYSLIVDTRKSTSLKLYQSEKGWRSTSTTLFSDLSKCILSKHHEESIQSNHKSPEFYIPRSLNINWSFRDHPRPKKIIDLFCKIPDFYSFMELSLQPNRQKTSRNLALDEIGLLKQLYYNRVVYPGFIPWQIIYEFSLNNFCIYLPNIPFSNLKELIKIIPFSEISFSDDFSCLFCRLTPSFADWIQSDLGWPIKMVNRVNPPSDLNSNWFDRDSLNWRIPDILNY